MSANEVPPNKDELDSEPLLPEHSESSTGRQNQKAWKWKPILKSFIALFTCLILYHYQVYAGKFNSRPCPNMHPLATEDSDPEKLKPPPMDIFEVYPPVRVSQDYHPELAEAQNPECKVLLMQHVFGWSYGKPFVGNYTPPPCEWTHVLFNLTMTSAGRQFDRLAIMFLGDIEVFRTSTAEPTWYGIDFNYMKDMTAYSSLLRKKQKIIFDLGNLVDNTYTGLFNATLTATFYTPQVLGAVIGSPADMIVPISQHNSAQNQPSHYHLPQERAKEAISFPLNTIRATVSISASGNANEEFWYTNVPNDFTETFGPENSLPGNSPFREIQLLVDGEVLGVAWPFATIFTGGINPGLWRPIVGIAAFDIPEYEIDITPFLPLLLVHPKPAVFEIKVVSWDPDPAQAKEIGTDWLVSGRVFIWKDDANWTTTGTIHKRSSTPSTFKLTTTLETDTDSARNTSLELRLTAHRFLSITSTIITSTGPRLASWTQGLSYSNTNILTANGTNQTVEQVTQGTIASTGTQALTFRWPLTVKSSFEVDEEHGNFTIQAEIDRTVEETSGHGRDPVFAKGPGTLYTRQNGSAIFVSGQYAKGITEQEMTFLGVPNHGEGVGSYRRWVKAEGGKLVEDEEMINGKLVEKMTVLDSETVEGDMAGWVAVGAGRRSVRSILGRGPG